MKGRLLWKLLLINIVPVITIVILMIWLAIDHLAAGYFMALMNKYDVSPTEIHQMFISSIHRYLIWASVAALGLACVLSFLLIRRMLRPLSQMTNIAGDMASGAFSARVDIISSDEIGRLGVAFNRMADSLEKLEMLRKTMVADVAHELRTPLTNLRGYLEGLNDGVIEPTSDTFHMLQQETLRLVHLVDDLGQLAKADAARAYLDREELSLSELVGQVLTLYRLRLQSKKIRVGTRIPPEVDRVVADREKLLLAVRNLVENACRYTPEEGSIEISSQGIDEGVKVLVANSGSTISEADLPYIFERFYRADRSRSRPTGGAGIGLAIVKELIEAHGGRVGADSSQSEARIWFILPA